MGCTMRPQERVTLPSSRGTVSVFGIIMSTKILVKNSHTIIYSTPEYTEDQTKVDWVTLSYYILGKTSFEVGKIECGAKRVVKTSCAFSFISLIL